jgi:hypothetical protein
MKDIPAFPTETEFTYRDGMTLRDYFAAKAMAIMWDAYDKGYCGLNDKYETIADGAYLMADAMLKAREL